MLKVKSFTFNPFQENTYVLSNAEGLCAIIDPGCYTQEEQAELSSYIQTQGLTPISLLNTHTHIDHVLGNYFVSDLYKLRPQMHRLELPIIRAIPSYASNYGLRYVASGEPEIFLAEGDVIKIGEEELNVLFTPGHSPGSISFYSKKEGFVISGDVLFYRGIGRTDLTGGDYNILIQAIESKLMTLPDDTLVYSGHGSSTTILSERLHNPFLNS